jgi:hypothetical protein
MNLDNYLTMSQLEDATGLNYFTIRQRLKYLGVEGVKVHATCKLYPKDCVEKLVNYADHRKKTGP